MERRRGWVRSGCLRGDEPAAKRGRCLQSGLEGSFDRPVDGKIAFQVDRCKGFHQCCGRLCGKGLHPLLYLC